MARPKLNTPLRRFYINLTLREGEDDDLIAFFERIPERQRVRAIKLALRTGDLATLQNDMDAEDDSLVDALDDLCFSVARLIGDTEFTEACPERSRRGGTKRTERTR